MAKHSITREILGNLFAWISYFLSAISVWITYATLPPNYRWLIPLLAAVVIVAGMFLATRKTVQHHDRESQTLIAERDSTITSMKTEIAKLKTHPSDSVLTAEVSRKLSLLGTVGHELVRYILMHGPVPTGVLGRFLKSKGQAFENHATDALVVGEKEGLFRRIPTRQGGRIDAQWDILDQFKPVLKDLLYPR